MLTLTLIVPAFNERLVIAATIKELTDYMSASMPETSYELIIIDDGSSDETAKIVEDCQRGAPNLRLVSHERNFGRGRAIRTGFEHALGEFVICLDADLSYAPDHIPALLEPLLTNQADIVMASAYHPDGKVENVPFSRAVMSKWGNRVLSIGVFGKFHTLTCVVRGYKRQALQNLELISDGKDLHLEIIQKALLFNLRVVEVPATLKWRDRKRGSKPSGGLLKRLPFFSMSGTIASHLVSNFILRPGVWLAVPFFVLNAITIIGTGAILVTWLGKFFSSPEGLSFFGAYSALRETLLQGQLTLAVISISLIISLIFAAFYFTSQQNKKNFDELYILLSRMNERIKSLEDKVDR